MPKRRESGKMRSAADMIKKINALDSSRKYSQVHVEFFGRREASIDGLYGVLEYDGERIRLSPLPQKIISSLPALRRIRSPSYSSTP